MFPLNDEKLDFNEDLMADPQPDLKKYWEETNQLSGMFVNWVKI